MRYAVLCLALLGIAGCGGQGPGLFDRLGGGRAEPAPVAEPLPAAEPAAAPDGPPETLGEGDPIETATLAPDDPGAAAAAPAGGGRLGTTIASLGDPAEPGFWLKTPLVTEPRQGRVVYAVSGRSVQVQLLPSGGPAGGGSQVSLAAMRLLDAPLTGLPELEVYVN